MPLASALSEAGFDVWTPVETRARLAGRDRRVVEQILPIMPGYVFAARDRGDDLLNMSRSPTLNFRVWDKEQRRMVIKGYPHFSVFLANGGIRTLEQAALAPLQALEADLARLAERRRAKALEKGEPPRFEKGQTVRVDSHGVAGLNLTVMEANAGKTVKLHHPDWLFPAHISAWKLRAVAVKGEIPVAA